MKIKLDLFSLLGNFMESIGVEKPKIISRNIGTFSHSVVIGFDGTGMPYPVKSGGPVLQETFYGDDPHSMEVAEHKAIMSLMNHLKKTYDIEVEDISQSKILACEEKCLEFLTEMDFFVGRFNVFLNKYENCTYELDSIISKAAEKECNGVAEIGCSVQVIMGTSLEKIKDVKYRIITAGSDGCGYSIGFSPVRRNDPLKVVPNVWSVSQKEILSFVLEYLGFNPAKYSNKMADEMFFIGNCKVNTGQCFGEEETGGTKICGDKKATPYEAECSAAEKMIKVLERIRHFELVDFNYDNLTVQRQKLSSIVQHRSRLESMFFEANATWSNMTTGLEELINEHCGLSQAFQSQGEESREWSAKMSIINDLDEAISSMKQVKYEAVSTMAHKI